MEQRTRVLAPEIQSIEESLDRGLIAIIPDTSIKSPYTEWKVVLLIKEQARQGAMDCRQGRLTWGDLNGRRLIFRNGNRPARRFLSLMQAKRSGISDIIEFNEQTTAFWPTPGEYLRKPTLTTLARDISGLWLPRSIIEDTTFENDAGEDYELDGIEIDTALSQIEESNKQRSEGSEISTDE